MLPLGLGISLVLVSLPLTSCIGLLHHSECQDGARVHSSTQMQASFTKQYCSLGSQCGEGSLLVMIIMMTS